MITIIAPAFQTFPILVPSLLCQTDGDWELLICHDGPLDEWEAWMQIYADPRIRWRSTRTVMGHYGHPIRRALLAEELNGRYTLMTNHDNYLIPAAVEIINRLTSNAVAWPIIHNYYKYQILQPRLAMGKIDLSSVAVRTDWAQDIGFPWTEHSADFLYIQEIARRTHDWTFLDMCLGVHN